MTIHIFSINNLANTLRTRKLGQKEQMYYFFANMCVIYLGLQYALWWGPRQGWLFWLELLIVIVIAVYGCVHCWKTNGGSSGKDLILRMVCFSVPVGILVTIVSVGLGLGLHFSFETAFMGGTFSDPYRAYYLVSYAGFVGTNIFYWYLLGSALKQTNPGFNR